MALLDKLKPQSDGTIIISAHDFTDSLAFWAEGVKARADLVAQFSLDDTEGNDKEQLDLLVAHYITLSATDKALYFDVFERGLRGLQSGTLNTVQFIAYIGLS